MGCFGDMERRQENYSLAYGAALLFSYCKGFVLQC